MIRLILIIQIVLLFTGNLVAQNIFSGGDNSGFSCSCVGSVGVEIPLPVELLSFYGKDTNNTNLLTWITATEINNDYFTIERSIDAKNWEIVAVVNGAGNSNQVLKYTYSDCLFKKEITYYRLKQTDFEGSFFYSEVISVISNKETLELNIYPNPTTGILIVKGKEIEQIEIIDVTGKTISKFTIKGNLQSIDLSNQAKGIYFVKAISKTAIITEKLILQ